MLNTKILMTANELRSAGWKALVETLGPTDATRFILQYERGFGDYAKTRHKLFGSKNVDELYSKVAKDKDERP